MKIPKPIKMSSGSYYIRLRLNGESISITESTEAECKAQAALIKAEYLTGKRVLSKSELTLKQACERYIAKKEKQGRSPETIRGYDVILNNRFQSVMDKKVTSIKNWQDVYDADAARLSPKTMANTWFFFKSVCEDECGVTLPNINLVAQKHNEHLFLEPNQITEFVAACKGNKYEIPMLLGLCSFRASEIRAITWDRVDLKNNRIHIKGAIVRDKNNNKVSKAANKTETSTRYVPIFIPQLRDALAAVEDKSGYVVTASHQAIYRQINSICKEHGFPEIGMHGLRHSFASLAYSLNIPIKIAMQIGGWADYNTMLKIYTHLSQRDVGKYTDDISKFFDGNGAANKNVK